MRFNESWLKQVAKQSNPDKEGLLEYRAPREGYRQRKFVLRGNLLFYFRINERGIIETEPLGVLIIEGCEVQMEDVSERQFVFSIVFPHEGGKKHYFSSQMCKQCEEWVLALKICRHSFMKAKMEHLRREIFNRTGEDYYETLVATKLKQLKLNEEPKQDTRKYNNISLPHILTASSSHNFGNEFSGTSDTKRNSTFFSSTDTQSWQPMG